MYVNMSQHDRLIVEEFYFKDRSVKPSKAASKVQSEKVLKTLPPSVGATPQGAINLTLTGKGERLSQYPSITSIIPTKRRRLGLPHTQSAPPLDLSQHSQEPVFKSPPVHVAKSNVTHQVSSRKIISTSESILPQASQPPKRVYTSKSNLTRPCTNAPACSNVSWLKMVSIIGAGFVWVRITILLRVLIVRLCKNRSITIGLASITIGGKQVTLFLSSQLLLHL